MAEQSNNQVYACIDGAKLSEAVCDYASWIATSINIPLNFLHTINHHHETSMTSSLTGNLGLGSREQVLEEITLKDQEYSKLKLQQGKDMLQKAKKRAESSGVSRFSCVQRHGDLIENLIELEDDIRVLVLGLRGQVHEEKSDQIGAKLEAIIRSLHRPVFIVNEDFKKPETIMIAYDGEEAADKAVSMVAQSELFHGMDCHLVCVNKNESMADQLLLKAINQLNKNDQLNISSHRLKGKADHELCAYQKANNIDLTIMGAFSHTRIHDMLIGSFTHKMLLHTNRPLLLLR